MANLERFGVYLGPGERVDRIDPSQTLHEVRQYLAEAFNFQLHDSALLFLNSPEHREILRSVLTQRGWHLDEIVSLVPQIAQNRALVVYTHDLSGAGEHRVDYMIFMGNVQAIDFPLVLAEEVVHGEHMSYWRVDRGLSKEAYDARFHEFTLEFLGYLGEKKLIQATGLRGAYVPTLDSDQVVSESDFAHLVAYFTLDALGESAAQLSSQSLFYAPDDAAFWRVVAECVGEPVELNLQFENSGDAPGFLDQCQKVIRASHAEEIILLGNGI